tara:strand:+ start:356 stop:1333 length:978 start_codon:yes stop_codon:yes gene_type:complete
MSENINVIGDAVNPVQGGSEAIPVETAGPSAPLDNQSTISKQNNEIPKDDMPQGQTYSQGSIAEPGDFESRNSNNEEKNNPSRHEYWQSQHDKVNNELGNAHKELQYLKQEVGPLADYLKKNPNVVNAIDQQLSNGQPQGQPQNQVQPEQRNLQAPLQKPNKPTTPSDYNEVDAYNDPDSSSFKHRTTMDGYRDNMISFMETKDIQREQFAQQQMAQQQLQAQQNQAISHVQNNYGFDQAKSQDFVNFITDPSNVTYDNLVEIYNKKNGPSQQEIQARQKMAEAKSRDERLKVPRETYSTPGTSAPQQTQEQAFSNSLLANGKRR